MDQFSSFEWSCLLSIRIDAHVSMMMKLQKDLPSLWHKLVAQIEWRNTNGGIPELNQRFFHDSITTEVDVKSKDGQMKEERRISVKG